MPPFTTRADPAVNQRLHDRIEQLATRSDEHGCLTRTILSGAMKAALGDVEDWMKRAGMHVSTDPLGNISGLSPHSHDEKRLLIGSHLDTVRNGGKYDGALGVLLGIACVEQLTSSSVTIPFPIEVVGFADEEGWKYHTPYLGSATFMGDFQASWLGQVDESKTTLADLLRDRGTKPSKLARSRDPGNTYWAFIEAHIEQGPILEAANCPLGVVQSIAGQTRASIAFSGRAGHAGTTPMNLRHDALPAAATLVNEVERYGCSIDNLVATVGQLDVKPNVSNVIPDQVELTLDVRHPDNDVRLAAAQHLHGFATGLATDRDLVLNWTVTQDQPAVICDERLCATLRDAASANNPGSPMLISGAGHDTVAVSKHVPAAMLFVRCRDGLSHHPDEYAAPSDIDDCLAVLVDFVVRSAETRLDEQF